MNVISQKLEFNSNNLTKLMEILKVGERKPRLIGGCVRDQLLHLKINDIDIATPLEPKEVIPLLKKHGIKSIPTGIDFGTITAVINGEAFEITSLRKDIRCDGRHALVKFTEDFAIDAARRDFTINALSYCPYEHKIYDYYNGLADLSERRVRFIGKPEERIEEDYLRILRFFRFSAYFALYIDQEGLESCVKLKDGLHKLPRERINIEMDKLLYGPGAQLIIQAMKDGNIDVMSGLKLNTSPIQIINKATFPISSLYTILLINNDQKILSYTLPLLRFSNKRKHEILDMISFMQKTPKQEDFLEVWVDNKDVISYIRVALSLKIIDQKSAINLEKKCLSHPPILPVNGTDLIPRFKGPEIGEALLKIKRAWIESDFTLNKETLMELYA